MDNDPVLVSVTHTPGGNWLTVWSLSPGKRIHLTIPAGQYSPETLRDLQTRVIPQRYGGKSNG